MKNLFFIILFLPCAFLARAQKSMYLYFESENHLPFYLKIDEKVYTSVSPGYYVLTGLEEGKHKLSVGIPSESRLENRFEINVERDRGLLIKKQGNELVLQDMHDGTSVRLIKDPSMPVITYEARNDAFTLLLSKATGDPGLLMSPVFAKAEPRPVKSEPAAVVFKPQDSGQKKEEVVAVVNPAAVPAKPDGKKESGTARSGNNDNKSGTNENIIEKTEKATALILAEKARDSAQAKTISEPVTTNNETKTEGDQNTAFQKSTVSKFAEGSSAEGFSLVFIDEDAGRKDTIRLMIPNPRFNLEESESKEVADPKFLEMKEDKESQKPGVPADSIKGKPEASPLINKEVPGQDSISQTAQKDAIRDTMQSTAEKSSLPKNNCKEMASDNDFFKLRKNMASQITDEEMVAEAKKYFKNRCFLTEQIKNLSSLFLTSAGKYLFFDAAFFHVSDAEQFTTLEEEIKDEYYKKRFKALVGL